MLAPSKSLQQPTDVPSHPAPPATGGGDSGTDGADFGSCLQSARDCINKRHEEELKALESFRMYVHKRARADAEYAATLGKINSLTAREMAGIGPTSVIVQVSLREGGGGGEGYGDMSGFLAYCYNLGGEGEKGWRWRGVGEVR